MPLFWKMGKKDKLFAPVTIAVWNSEAYRTLTDKQTRLFTFCAMQRASENKARRLPLDHFYMNASMYRKEGWRPDTFTRDMEALIMHGFIDCAVRGEHKKSVYTYSDRWKCYGSKDGEPKPRQCTKALLQKLYPEEYAKEYLTPCLHGKNL